MTFGWVGTVLEVDLSSGRISRHPLPEELARDYLGGRGINVRLLYERVKPGTEGLSPENVLVFGTGPLTGTMVAAGRLNITAICPETNMLGDTNGGSHFSAELKFAGYDHIIFTGKAEHPVYLWINDDEVQIRDARHLAGKFTDQTLEMIRDELGDKDVQTCCIGPAGENLVRVACVSIGADGTGGKFGLGAVMGSKNLKAVAVRGTKGVRIAHPQVCRALFDELTDKQLKHPIYPRFSRFGTTMNLVGNHVWGDTNCRNGQEVGPWDEGFEAIGPESLYERYTVKNKSCFGCIAHCRRFFEIKEGPYAGLRSVGFEYATQLSLGALNDITDAPAVYKTYVLCNQYGLDSNQAGMLSAAATEWYEKGILTKEDTGGLEFKWGSAEAMQELIRKIVYREDVGDLLAEGALHAARKLGNGAEKCLTHMKGIVRTTGDVRCRIGHLLGQAVATRGADHLRGSEGRHPYGKYEGAAEAVYSNQIVTTLADALELCKFTTTYKLAMDVEDMTKFFNAATGLEVDQEQMKTAADRIWNLERAMIVRAGIRRKDDIPAGRIMDEPVKSGPRTGARVDPEKFDEQLDIYYRLNGWDKETGIPTRSRLEALGLGDVAAELEETGDRVVSA